MLMCAAVPSQTAECLEKCGIKHTCLCHIIRLIMNRMHGITVVAHLVMLSEIKNLKTISDIYFWSVLVSDVVNC
jgi:hypothetical protein